MNTKEKILAEALSLFSVRGYDPVSVRDIAHAVGIKESSLYNHFKNKQDIFDSIINEYSRRGDLFFHQIQLTGEDMRFDTDEKTVDMYRNMPAHMFEAIGNKIFEFYFIDEINVKLRKMLTIEQYRNPKMAELYRKLSFEDSINYQSGLFEVMIQAQMFVEADPYMLAMAFVSPIFLIFYMFDNDKNSLNDARSLFERHIRHFRKTYAKADDNNL